MELPNELVFIGLGNPGKQYEYTRHNLGFLVIHQLSEILGIKLREERHFQARIGKGEYNNKIIHLMQPMTYMNASGLAVRQYLAYYKLSPSQIVVIVDDTALSYGQVRLRIKGSSGGHNGLKSVASSLSTEDYTRLRIGIGSNTKDEPLSEYVLSRFNSQEMAHLDNVIKCAVEVLKDLTSDTLIQVMSRVNTKVTL